MAYKIAVASSDGVHVDLKFGEAVKFLIYEVMDSVRLFEERLIPAETGTQDKTVNPDITQACHSGGCSGNGSGCHGSSGSILKVEQLLDCRCIVCKKFGLFAQKQFEKKAIQVFDVDCSVQEALDKITFYYHKIDNHETFRNT